VYMRWLHLCNDVIVMTEGHGEEFSKFPKLQGSLEVYYGGMLGSWVKKFVILKDCALYIFASEQEYLAKGGEAVLSHCDGMSVYQATVETRDSSVFSGTSFQYLEVEPRLCVPAVQLRQTGPSNPKLAEDIDRIRNSRGEKKQHHNLQLWKAYLTEASRIMDNKGHDQEKEEISAAIKKGRGWQTVISDPPLKAIGECDSAAGAGSFEIHMKADAWKNSEVVENFKRKIMGMTEAEVESHFRVLCEKDNVPAAAASKINIANKKKLLLANIEEEQVSPNSKHAHFKNMSFAAEDADEWLEAVRAAKLALYAR